jgi:hypothetical protein
MIATPMRKFFKPKPFLDPVRREWQFDTFAWLLRHTGGYPKFSETLLVLPIEAHFPDRGLSGHAGVSALFRRVRDHAGMADWPCSVAMAKTASPEPAAAEPVIVYNPEVNDPAALVATFSHELAEYLIGSFSEEPPGGASLRDPAIDIAAVFMGFGLFLANASYQFGEYESGAWAGWRTRAAGALNEGELVHALALFCVLRNFDTESVEKHLNRHLRKYLRLAVRDLAQYPAQFYRLRATFPLAERDPANETLPTMR